MNRWIADTNVLSETNKPHPHAAVQAWLDQLPFGSLYTTVVNLAEIRFGISQVADSEKAKRLKAETEQAIADYEKAMTEARGKAGAIAQAERDKLKAEMDQERARVDGELSKRLADAEAQIASAKSAALGEVHGIAGETVETLVQELLGIKVDKDEALAAVARAQAK